MQRGDIGELGVDALCPANAHFELSRGLNGRIL